MQWKLDTTAKPVDVNGNYFLKAIDYADKLYGSVLS